MEFIYRMQMSVNVDGEGKKIFVYISLELKFSISFKHEPGQQTTVSLAISATLSPMEITDVSI